VAPPDESSADEKNDNQDNLGNIDDGPQDTSCNEGLVLVQLFVNKGSTFAGQAVQTLLSFGKVSVFK
jgi:hypothetical protein